MNRASSRARRAGFAGLAGLAGLAALFGTTACIKPPAFVMVDRATALEQQAAGSFDEEQKKLDRAAVEPRPVPLTPEQLQSLGVKTAPGVDSAEMTDADRLDDLLVQHCIGEGSDGLLVDTRDACKGAADEAEVEQLIDRVNRARRQLWRWMHEQRSSASLDDLRRGWQRGHVQAVVCGGWVEGDDGKWQGKSC
jgi:hypothetical protein